MPKYVKIINDVTYELRAVPGGDDLKMFMPYRCVAPNGASIGFVGVSRSGEMGPVCKDKDVALERAWNCALGRERALYNQVERFKSLEANYGN